MSYTKQTWNTGDVITAEKLNHMEDGIMESGESSKNCVMFVTLANDGNDNYTADKTIGEITEAYNNGKMIYVIWITPTNAKQLVPLYAVITVNETFSFAFSDTQGGLGNGGYTLTTTDAFAYNMAGNDMWRVTYESHVVQLAE